MKNMKSFVREKNIFGLLTIPTFLLFVATFYCLNTSSVIWFPWKENGVSTVFPWWFDYIDEDLEPWKAGIVLKNIEDNENAVNFRFQIISGNLYLFQQKPCFQSRMEFTILGILLLLEKFKGRVPDVDVLFNCLDRPIVPKLPRVTGDKEPPVFQYCNDRNHSGLVFPDWSFWGWPELNIASWEKEKGDILFNNKKQWLERIPRALWRGNSRVVAISGSNPNRHLRPTLMNCSDPPKFSYGVECYDTHAKKGKRIALDRYIPLKDQCTHRYRIYAEGIGWSVGLKYALPCNSTYLLIEPIYFDFFSRGLIHSNPHASAIIPRSNLCKELHSTIQKFEENPKTAMALANQAVEFAREDLSIDNVYNYMLQVLQKYSSLLSFRPSVKKGSTRVTIETVLGWIQTKGLGVDLESLRQELRIKVPFH